MAVGTHATTALATRCEVCKAKPNEKCRNTINPDAPLPGREFHIGRIERRDGVRVWLQGEMIE